MLFDNGVEPGFVDSLLSSQTREQQIKFLRDKGLLDASGLDRLLDDADRLLKSDPGKAQQLAELCAEAAKQADAPVVFPRANYLLAGVHSINGEFEEDLRLTKTAHDGYLDLGMDLEALRTKVGEMAALTDLGRYEEALGTGRAVLDALEGEGKLQVTPSQRDRDLLAALVHQNLGGCLEYMGRYDEALDAYVLAEKLYEKLDMQERLGEVLDNRGAILSYLGRGNEALSSHRDAAAIFEKAGLTLSHAMSLSNIGQTYFRLANYMSSLDAFKRAQHALRPFNAQAEEYFLLRNTADAYLALNLRSEALALYRDVDGLLRSVAGMEDDRARALWGMGSALMAGSEIEKAEEALTEAARLFAAADNVPLLSSVMLEQASLLAVRGDRTAARARAHRALDLVVRGAWPVQQVYARLRLADLLLPDVKETERHLLEAQRLTDRLALPQLRYRLNERLGHLRRLQGRNEEGRVLLEAALSEIERLRGAVSQDAIRASFLQDKTAPYEDLLLLNLEQNDDDDSVRRAFAVAERAKSRALVDLLTGVSERSSGTTDSTKIEDRIQILQADLNAIYSELLGGSSGDGRLVPLPNLQARAVELEQEIGLLRLQSTTVGPAPDLFAASVPPDDIQDRLSPDTALLAYHVLGKEIIAFVHARGRTRVARDLGPVTEVHKLLHRLDVQWERFRAGRGFAERHITMLERSARQVLAELYDRLVAPLEPLLDDATPTSGEVGAALKLAVVPHGPLHRISFHALFDGQRYLIERFEISYAPSATVYALCQERDTRSHNGQTAIFGVEDPSIPAAEVEARAVADRVPDARLHVGEEATVEALRSAASESGTLHMACHGLFRSDNPMFSALKLHDGWLVSADVLSLDLPDALVTLSACESGRSEVIGGDEILGLTRSFLGAGAATLVVSLWLVQDETTAELMGKWYEQLGNGEGTATALRAAQLEVKDRYRHPYYWAPFVLVGKR